MTVIIISPLTLVINRRKLGEEGVQKNWEKTAKWESINWVLLWVSLPRTTHSRKSSSPLQINWEPKWFKVQKSYTWFLQKPSSLFKKTSSECKIIKARQLFRQLHLSSLRKLFTFGVLDTFSTLAICRGLRFSEFQSAFLGICECVFGPSFILNLDI